jgi:hypothetical protein
VRARPADCLKEHPSGDVLSFVKRLAIVVDCIRYVGDNADGNTSGGTEGNE